MPFIIISNKFVLGLCTVRSEDSLNEDNKKTYLKGEAQSYHKL